MDYLTPEEASKISEGELEVKPFLVEDDGAGEAREAGEAGETGEAVEMEIADTKQQGIYLFSDWVLSWGSILEQAI